MSLSDTVGGWGKQLRKVQHVGAGITPSDRWAGRSNRPTRKEAKRDAKKVGVARKMANSGYPAKFTSHQEEETD